MPRLTVVAFVFVSSLFATVIRAADMRITLILVPERDACGGGDYNTKCKPIDIDDVADWADNPQRPHVTQTLRAGSQAFKMSDEFFDFFKRLVDYDPSASPDRRFAVIVYVTSGKRKKETNGSLRRGSKPPLISSTEARVPLSVLGRGFTHQRADAFKPAYAIGWKLTVDDVAYRFFTEKP